MIALVLVACGPGPRSWPPVDAVALQNQLDNPTAPRPDVEGLVEELRDIVSAGGDLGSLTTALDPVLAEPGVEAPENPQDDVISGTSAFFDVACPGEGSAPDPDFAQGRARLEGPFLIEDGTGPAIGPLFLTFEACALLGTVLDGELRASWLADDQRLLALGDLTLVTNAVELSWDAGFALDPSGLELSYTLDRGTITLAFATDAVQVAYADGAATCTLDDPVNCGFSE